MSSMKLKGFYSSIAVSSMWSSIWQLVGKLDILFEEMCAEYLLCASLNLLVTSFYLFAHFLISVPEDQSVWSAYCVL